MNSPDRCHHGGILARGLVKHYEDGRVKALDELDLDITSGEFVAICGPSGCGKSTLLNMIAAIDRPDAGRIEVGGTDLSLLRGQAVDEFRALAVGLVFQLHNLLPNLTAVENVQVPMMSRCTAHQSSHRDRAAGLLDRVGLGDRLTALPTTLSGGERQRVAIARALANEPRVLLADEPTGALDSKSGDRLFDLLDELRRERRMTLVVVTHDARVAARAERIVSMVDGRITPDPL
jgi:putative ABC transport system ATP-binding protein